MIKLENVRTYAWDDALRGMRNPLNSWERADSTIKYNPDHGYAETVNIGPNDERLIRALDIGGAPHRKFLRQIFVTVDITAPAYFWAELDTYKVATTRNSCSVQHKGASRDFVMEDFTFDTLPEMESNEIDKSLDIKWFDKHVKAYVLDYMNALRLKYLETKDYTYFRMLRQIMPMGYNYRATWSGNYETLMNIFEWRHNHKLSEWHVFCDEILKNAPYFDKLVEFVSNKSIDK